MKSFVALAIVIAGAHIAMPAEPATINRPVRIGVVKTLFRGMPDALIQASLEPFKLLMTAQTGLQGDVTTELDPMNVARDIEDGRLDLGVFQGVEFAWVKQRFSNFEPLMIAVYGQRQFGACLVVRADSSARSVADLRSHTLYIPIDSRLHCHLYLDLLARASGAADARRLFRKVQLPDDAEESLDNVIDRTGAAALVDSVSWSRFERRKPTRVLKLKVLSQSEPFPPSVVVYRRDRLTPELLKRFEHGLVTANKNALGRQFLTLWKLTGFEEVPADFNSLCGSIVHDYPRPAQLPSTFPSQTVEVGKRD